MNVYGRENFNNKTVELILENYEELTDLRLSPDAISDEVDLAKAGFAIMKSTTIQSISLRFPGEIEMEKYDYLFRGIGKSLSVKSISIYGSRIKGSLCFVLKAKNLQRLAIRESMIGFDAPVMMRIKWLQELFLCSCYFEHSTVQAELFSKLKRTNDNGELRSISLYDIYVNQETLAELNNLLICANTKIDDLVLQCSNGDGVMGALADGIVKCTELKRLSTSLSTNVGWQPLSDTLVTPGSFLCDLDLRSSEIHYGDGAVFARGIANNTSLKRLDLSSLAVMEDEDMMAVMTSLPSNKSLEHLELNDIDSISDDMVQSFANGLVEQETKLRILSMDSCSSVSAAGWASLSAILQNHHSRLHSMHLSSNNINDDVVGTFVDVLRDNGNSALHTLDIQDPSGPLTNDGWDRIGNLLCDPSSVNSTRSSNHVLCNLGSYLWPDPPNTSDMEVVSMPHNVEELLKTNEINDKRAIARKKVIDTHFSGAQNKIPLIDKQKLLPALLSWAGKDDLGYSTVYHIIRKEPSLLNLN